METYRTTRTRDMRSTRPRVPFLRKLVAGKARAVICDASSSMARRAAPCRLYATTVRLPLSRHASGGRIDKGSASDRSAGQRGGRARDTTGRPRGAHIPFPLCGRLLGVGHRRDRARPGTSTSAAWLRQTERDTAQGRLVGSTVLTGDRSRSAVCGETLGAALSAPRTYVSGERRAHLLKARRWWV